MLRSLDACTLIIEQFYICSCLLCCRFCFSCFGCTKQTRFLFLQYRERIRWVWLRVSFVCKNCLVRKNTFYIKGVLKKEEKKKIKIIVKVINSLIKKNWNYLLRKKSFKRIVK